MDISDLRERGRAGVFTVSELNGYIKNLFDGDRTLSAVTVKGEISNFKNHSSGHLYFSLKDEEGQIRSVMFRSSAMRLRFAPESGMRVIAHGTVSVYPRDGSYQMYVNSMQPDGIGALYLAYEQLKEKLSREGLFDSDRKLQIPRLPRRIGVITSPTGAAVRDIINVTHRRFPLADIYLYPALVQGDGAAESLIRAVDYFDRSRLCDTVIIGRGGGSIEDLWAFNDERLARRIAEATVPIISAVGHETDFTICDFVSDLRAPTPSAAAEQAVPDARELYLLTDSLYDRSVMALRRRAERARERLERLSEKVTADDMINMLHEKRVDLSLLYQRVLAVANKRIEAEKGRLVSCAAKLTALDPLSVLARGYAVVRTEEGKPARAQELSVGEAVNLQLADGFADANITKIVKNGE